MRFTFRPKHWLTVIAASGCVCMSTVTAQRPSETLRPVTPAAAAASDAQHTRPVNTPPSIISEQIPGFRPGAVLEGSVLATLGNHTHKDQHSERLCRTSEALLEAARLLAELPASSQRSTLVQQLRTEAVTCLRQAGY